MTENQTVLRGAPRYEYSADVMVHMCDDARICRPADLMRFMQESATRQLEALGPDTETLRALGRAFILSRISIDFPTPVRTFSRVRCTTWPCTSSRGAAFDRCFEIFDAQGAVAARAVSQWAFLDYRNHRLLRGEDVDLSFARDEQVEVSLPLRFRIPKDAVLAQIGERRVCYSDIDTNCHMNNTRYCDLYCDFLPMAGARVTALSVVFAKEALPGDTITVLRTESPDTPGLFYFRTLCPDDSVNTEATVRLERIVS